MNDKQLERYSRQILVPEIDIAGQNLLLKSKVLIVGIGGLGCPASQYLTSSGVGNLLLADYDNIELSNLSRQTLFTEKDCNNNKAVIAKNKLVTCNKDVIITAITQKLTFNSLTDYIKKVDLVLDCTDSFATRFSINKACLDCKVPLVFGSAIRQIGQLSVFDFRQVNTACLGCLYEQKYCKDDSCLSSGVIGAITGIIGSMMALAAIKLITNNNNQEFINELLSFDATNWSWNKIRILKDKHCTVCSTKL